MEARHKAEERKMSDTSGMFTVLSVLCINSTDTYIIYHRFTALSTYFNDKTSKISDESRYAYVYFR